MKWITRERPRIGRIACPWLIARFIDPDTEFLYVPPDDVLRIASETDAIPYDIPGVKLSHEGESCIFDTFLKKYALTDPALFDLAVIVRGADTDRLDIAPQSAGLLAISLGLSHIFPGRPCVPGTRPGDLRCPLCLVPAHTKRTTQEVCNLRWEWEVSVPELDTSVFIIPGNRVKNGDERLVVLNRVASSVIGKIRGEHPDYVFTYQGHPVITMNN